jgi:selenocysteine lyase/cysteine desulfurase
MFQVARSIENSDTGIKSGDNIVLSRACHDANISPWLLMAKKLNLEVRWLDCLTQGMSIPKSAK